MLPYKAQARRVLFTDNNTGRPFQQCAQQRTDACRPGADNEHGILRADFRNAYRPKTRGQHVAHQKSLAVADIGRNPVQPLIGIRHPDILRLSPVDAAAQRPPAVRISAVVYIAMLAKKAFAAKRLYIYRHSVSRLYSRYCRPHSLHHAHHFVPNGNARHSARHRAMLNVQIAGADAGQRYPDNRIPVILQGRLLFFLQFEFSAFHISIGQHNCNTS